MVVMTAFVEGLITVTLLELALATYSFVPLGSSAAATGLLPTPIVATTVLVPVSMTETLLEVLFRTNALGPAAPPAGGAMPAGVDPEGPQPESTNPARR